MTLMDDFYRVSAHQLTDGLLQATLVFDPAHRIFEGHFPGQPVVPGVCMMQIVKELVEKYVLGTPTRLTHADAAKFLRMIDPRETASVEAEVRHENGKVVARLYSGDTVYFKYTATFKTR
ncbi:3-hydroxyacyl-ACP dehydratase [Dinghuibacter silviterrae]|uniref:3-hydroxyacyl-[acyl-carrier-protein] dehydratase n=1 Tax=Dinghuibacter silviterrae TaxID=1539049 RepID=A0A4R8DV43_9BACT|nr:3-hydroxyacyl-ACP dehydratase [Dinghuibacter silviterrae]TDX02274.1 3-hydroxyacyl-[acyl-carrier-protein] dehydratase [Dinghuibacter silviterrae]